MSGAAPLTDAELDYLDALNRVRTPGPLSLDANGRRDARICVAATGSLVALACGDADGAAIAAALNALPALLAEVRRWRGRERARDAWAEPDGDDEADVSDDDGPRLHIPRDLLSRGTGG